MLAAITLYSKPKCPHCEEAKEQLDRAGLPYETHNIADNLHDRDTSVYRSGAVTVPQIFVDQHHINGADELRKVAENHLLSPLLNDAEVTDGLAQFPKSLIHQGAEDYLLRDVIPESDGTHDEDPETWPILHFYKDFFGFWPNCFYYQHHWHEAYKLFVYCHNTAAIMGGKNILGSPVMMAVIYSTSKAHGCAYCTVHSASVGGEKSALIPDLVEKSKNSIFLPNSPIGPFEASLANLAANATLNKVNQEDIERIYATAFEARVSKESPEANITAAALACSALGFLNVFNDLTGVKVEAEWANSAEKHGINPGRHGASYERASDNLNYDLPQLTVTMPEMMAKYEGIVADKGSSEAYAQEELAIVPCWLKRWPEQYKATHIYFYSEIMQPRVHSAISSELKHLMLRVSAIAKGHDEIAADEAYMAWCQSDKTETSVERLKRCYGVASGEYDSGTLFSDEEVAALMLARQSAMIPLVTVRRFVEPATKAFDSTELIHLITVCAMGSLVQRFSAIMKPRMNPESEEFCRSHEISCDSLLIRVGLA